MKKLLPLVSLFGALAIFYWILDYHYDLFHLPFFWDELGVYSRAAMHLSVHGLSLLPDSMPDVLSRGHPLLTPFIFGTTFKLFGVSQITARLTGLFIFGIGVGFGYKILAQNMNAWWAVAFTFCIAIQPAFVAQSVLVLPETLLMTLTLAAIYFYLIKNNIGLWITLSLAVLTKESGLVLPIAFALAQWQQKRSWKVALSSLLIPFLIFIGFLVIQKIQNGYFLYPLHQGLMDFSPITIIAKIGKSCSYLFIDQGRWLVTLSVLIISYTFKVKDGKTSSELIKLDNIYLWILLGGVCFSGINYYLERYVLFFLFPALLVLALKTEHMHKWLKLSIIFGTIAFSIYHLDDKTAFKDTNFSYVQHVRCQEKAFDEIGNLIPKNATVGYNWPMVMANWSNNSGYNIPENQRIDQFDGKNTTDFDYVVVSKPGKDILYREFTLDHLTHIKTIQEGYARVSIYKVRLNKQ